MVVARVLLVGTLLLFVQTCSGQQALAGGRFQTTTDVTSWLNLANDAADIRESDDETEKKNIYNNGRNAVFTSDGGAETKRTLAGLSLNSYPRMAQDSLYNIFRHTFFLIGRDIEGEPAGNFDQKPVQEYANTLVNDLFALNVAHIETEAAIIMNVWMEIVHNLEDALRGCKANDSGAMNAALDVAAALWIGADQPEGVNDQGNMMYNLAQVGGERFNQASGESASNKKVLDGMNELQTKISGGTCANGDEGYVEMRSTVNTLLGSMTIPLMQILIHHIQQQPADGGANFIELYALSFLPRVEACDPSAYKKLLTLLVRNTLKEQDKGEAISVLQEIYNCLGFSCQDIGSYESGDVASCSDDEVQPEGLAGYAPTSDVHPYSFLDRDILAIKKMTHMGAYDAAMDWYKYGFNARQSETDYLTLHKLAISPFREVVTNQYGLYEGYFGSSDYADKIITNVLTSVAPFDLSSPEQRAELVGGYLNEMVMYMAVLEKLYEASKLCENNKVQSQQSLDQAVAFYVGSMEGPPNGGLDGGQLLYATSKALCDEFEKCIDGEGSAVNQKLIQSFSAMGVSIQLGACPEVLTTLETEIEPLFPVTLIQGSLHYAAVNAALDQGAEDASLGSADPFALSIVPFVNNVNADSGTKLLTNLQFRPDLKPVADSPGEIFALFRNTIPQMALDVNCDDVGRHSTFGSVCSGGGPTPTASPGGGGGGEPTSETTPTASPVAPPQGDDSLGFGRYTFTADVSIAKLALDVRDMRNAGSSDAAMTTYSAVTNGPVSLASFSLDATNQMAKDIAFNVFRFALAPEGEFGDGSYLQASTYADVAVQKALTTAADTNLAAEASVVLHTWMQVAHYLYESVRVCENGGTATDPLDLAVALWLGEGQSQGNDDTGFLMYSIAEKAASRFGHDVKTEAPVNTKLIGAFNEARALAVDCPAAPELFLDLRGVVADTLKTMALPLIQNLIYYISKSSSNAPDYLEMENYVELYALSVVPHLIGCKPTSFFDLEEKLIDNDFKNEDINAEITENLKDLQKCFDIDCSTLMADKIADTTLLELARNLCVEKTDGSPSIVGYQPATDVSQFLRLDQDIVQIGILAETEAFDTAIDMYVNGYNSRRQKRAVSLRSLAISPDRAAVPEVFQLFTSYFESDKYADETIVNALRAEGQFAQAIPQQRREAAIRTLQSSVSYLALLTQLYVAVDKCKAGDDGKSWWDKGVALFVGSIEGELSGGDPNDYGELLYSLGKETCDDFGTCEGSGNAASNEALMSSFNSGLGLLGEDSCDSVAKMIKTDIIPELLVSMVQATLDYSEEMDDLNAGTDDDVLATGFALSRAILPQMNASNSTSASVVSSAMDFQLTSAPVPNGSGEIFDAVTFSISGMGVDCKEIGSLDEQSSVCSGALRPHQSTPTEMGGGSYTSTTYVQDRANIALDVLAIRNALNSGNPDLAELLYADGENSAVYNENGVQTGTRSLKSFSIDAPTDMADEPLFNIFRFALRDDQGMFQGQDAGVYADTIVKEAFGNTNPSSQTIAAEAVVIFNVWMYLVHELYQTLRQCKNKAIVDKDGIHSIDEAAAYWIGDGQVTGNSQEGHLLYALAEQMGEKFGLDESGQSRTNTNILRLFNQAKLEFSAPTACSDNPDTFPKLSQIVNRIVSWMTVPLVQGLISNLRENDKDRVKMYARAVLPLVAGCSESTYQFLSDKLFAEDYNVVEVEGMIARLQTTYECLGFTCADVGTHELDSTQSCTDPPVLSPLAGYVPQSDVRSFALLDLDILHANILMQMGAYGAVEDLYAHGKHALVEDENGLETLSLYKMATTSQRSIVPQFDSFTRYYESDKYADEIIRKALNTSDDKFGQASREQRREIVVKTMQYLVVYMAALQEMYQAIADCNSAGAGKVMDAQEAWDRGAAFLIGSLEGPEDGGNGEGLSFYRLALKRCEQFGTCAPEGRPSWNDEFSSLLYTGRASVQGGACGELRKTVREIETLLLVPLIQGTLRYALHNEKLGENSPDKGIGEGYAFSRSVLPLVDDSNRDSANAIADNMDFQVDKVPVHQGAQTVFSSFAVAYGKMNVNCEDIGKAEGHDACSGATSPGARDTNVGMIVGIICGVFALLAIIALVVYDRKRKKKAMEPTPTFVRPKGEMNHTSDRMAGSVYTSGEEAAYDEDDDLENPDMAVLVEPSPSKTEPMNDDSDDSSDNSFCID